MLHRSLPILIALAGLQAFATKSPQGWQLNTVNEIVEKDLLSRQNDTEPGLACGACYVQAYNDIEE
jgi:hypothetical protein